MTCLVDDAARVEVAEHVLAVLRGHHLHHLALLWNTRDKERYRSGFTRTRVVFLLVPDPDPHFMVMDPEEAYRTLRHCEIAWKEGYRCGRIYFKSWIRIRIKMMRSATLSLSGTAIVKNCQTNTKKSPPVLTKILRPNKYSAVAAELFSSCRKILRQISGASERSVSLVN